MHFNDKKRSFSHLMITKMLYLRFWCIDSLTFWCFYRSHWCPRHSQGAYGRWYGVGTGAPWRYPKEYGYGRIWAEPSSYIAILEPQYLKITKYSQNQWKSWNFMIFRISELGEWHHPVGTTAPTPSELFYLAWKNIFLSRKNIFEISVVCIYGPDSEVGALRAAQLQNFVNPLPTRQA